MRRAAFVALFLIGSGLLYALEHAHATAPFSTRPILYLVADAEQQAERIPLTVTRVSDDEEMKIGRQLVDESGLKSQPTSDPDQDRIQDELNSVGQRVAGRVRRTGIHYRFFLANDAGFVNAYALPGGNIVVGRGILQLIESEDELAMLLGHEIAHVDNRHAIERLQYELASRKLGLDGLYELGKPAVELFQAGYSKEQELDADRSGLDLAVAAGYSPAGAIHLMNRFVKLEQNQARGPNSPIVEIAEAPWDALSEYFRSHPPATERLAAIESEINSAGYDRNLPTRPLAIRPIFLADEAARFDRAGHFADSIRKYHDALALDAKYGRAWQGVARVEWRSGDAAETVHAESEAIALQTVSSGDWRILAEALSIADPQNDLSRFPALMNTVYPKDEAVTDVEPNLTAQADLAGMKKLHGQAGADAEFEAILSHFSDPSYDALLLREFAWWEYRAGKLDDAAKHLESAHQFLPNSQSTDLERVWILSDLKRQADAQDLCASEYSPNPGDEAAWQAACALVKFRTDEQSAASSKFQQAAAADPVWMVSKWVANNYSAQAAAAIKQLQVIEIARRMKEFREQHKAERAAPNSQ